MKFGIRCVVVAVLLLTAGLSKADAPVAPPAGAVVLFDGKDQSHWVHRDGSPCDWALVDDGAMEVKVGKGDVITKEKYGDCTLHVEFWIPKLPPEVKGQARGNSGVFLTDQYEIQVLDSFGLTPGKGDCGAIYNRKAPDVNACKEPEQWQTYDITFKMARFDKDGKKTANARVTVLQNGTKIHDDVEIEGHTRDKKPETPGPGPIQLQEHHHAIRFRNIWVVPAANESGPEVNLFDGTNINGWHQAGPGHFDFKDGLLTTSGGMGLFWNEREFGDFILTLDFKATDPSANSGVFVRFPDPGNDPWVAVNHGHEIQICDTEPKFITGGIYGFKNPTELATKPAGEWNHYEIKVVGQHYTVKLNDKVVNEFDSPDRPLRGRIGLQNHPPTPPTVSFRNVKVVELSAPDAPPKAAPAPAAPQSAAPIAAPAPQPVVMSIAPVPSRDLVPGLVGEYFKSIKELSKLTPEKKPFLVRVDKSINFPAVEGQFYETKLDYNFGARWTGFVHVDTAGTYKITVESDDSSRLFLSNQLVIGNDKPGSMKPKSAQVSLTPGDYPMRVEFQQAEGSAGMVLSWLTPGGGGTAPIPDSALFHERGADKIAWNADVWNRTHWNRKVFRQANGSPSARMDYGPFLSHTLEEGQNNTTLKGIAIQLDDNEESGVIFDTELMRFSAGWTGGFLKLHGVAFDGAHGPSPSVDGDVLFATAPEPGCFVGPARAAGFVDPRAKPFGPLPREWARYHGLYRNGRQIVVSYTIGDRAVLELPGLEYAGKEPVFTRTIDMGPSEWPVTLLITGHHMGKDGIVHNSVAYPDGLKFTQGEDGRSFLTFPASSEHHTYKIAISRKGAVARPDLLAMIDKAADVESLCHGGPELWKKTVVTKGELGKEDGPYVVDTVTAPEENPYKSWMRFGGFDFFSDGRAAVCTWSGDVWIVSGIDDKLEKLTWKRYASGLFQTLGLKIVNDEVYVLGRDQITHLHDLNGDGEADFYECFNNDCQVSSSFHEFAFDLQTDNEGNFYFSKAGPVRPGGRGWQIITDHNGCLLKVSKDGSKFEVFAVGLRAPNGMSVGPNDEVTIADNEGTWTPACRLSIVKKGMMLGVPDLARRDPKPTTYDKPICWLPHGNVDNSSGGQVWVTSDKWGPFKGELLHMSYGQCALFKVLKEPIGDIWQGGVVQFPLHFESGIMRARFNPIDQQLYVAGLRGWQTTAVKDCCLQRVRYTGKPVNMPTDLHVRKDGIEIGFTEPIDAKAAADDQNYSVEQWNYLWSEDYGSPEFSVEKPKEKGHDPVEVESVTVAPDHKSVFLKIANLKPVMQMKIQMKLKTAEGGPMEYAIYNTINEVPGKPATMPVAGAQAAAKAR